MGGMGLDAAMIANTSGDLKKKVGWVAYVDGAAARS
jgi:diacylglycerol kinase family enzyme